MARARPDYRWFRDSANSPAGDPASTTLPNSHPSYLGNGSRNIDPFFASLFPSPPSTVEGSPGNIWTTVVIDVDNDAGLISMSFDGQLTYRGEFAGAFDGLVSLGLCDVFSSVDPGGIFTVYDNLEVESLPSIGSAYCSVVTNSSGAPAALAGTGSDLASANSFALRATDMPVDSFGLFVVSSVQGFTTPMSSVGNLCLGGNPGRGVGGGVFNSGLTGSVAVSVDLSMIPDPMAGSVADHARRHLELPGLVPRSHAERRVDLELHERLRSDV